MFLSLHYYYFINLVYQKCSITVEAGLNSNEDKRPGYYGPAKMV